jgi:hypothetical protein
LIRVARQGFLFSSRRQRLYPGKKIILGTGLEPRLLVHYLTLVEDKGLRKVGEMERLLQVAIDIRIYIKAP